MAAPQLFWLCARSSSARHRCDPFQYARTNTKALEADEYVDTESEEESDHEEGLAMQEQQEARAGDGTEPEPPLFEHLKGFNKWPIQELPRLIGACMQPQGTVNSGMSVWTSASNAAACNHYGPTSACLGATARHGFLRVWQPR